MASRVKTQHYSGVNNFDADLGSIDYVVNGATIGIRTNLKTIVSVNFHAGDAVTNLGSITVVSPSLSNGEYKVVGGQIIVQRSATGTAGATLFYTLIGY